MRLAMQFRTNQIFHMDLIQSKKIYIAKIFLILNKKTYSLLFCGSSLSFFVFGDFFGGLGFTKESFCVSSFSSGISKKEY